MNTGSGPVGELSTEADGRVKKIIIQGIAKDEEFFDRLYWNAA